MEDWETPSNFNDYWPRLEETGWLEEIPEKHRGALREKVEKAFDLNPELAGHALAEFTFEPYRISEGDDYIDLIELFSEGSNDHFGPQNIEVQEDEESGTYLISFLHAGETYSCEVLSDDDYVDDQVVDTMNEALEDADEPRRFFLIAQDDDPTLVYFISPDVFDRAVNAGLLTSGDSMEIDLGSDFLGDDDDDEEL